jgi:hypothetical protein
VSIVEVVDQVLGLVGVQLVGREIYVDRVLLDYGQVQLADVCLLLLLLLATILDLQQVHGPLRAPVLHGNQELVQAALLLIHVVELSAELQEVAEELNSESAIAHVL